MTPQAVIERPAPSEHAPYYSRYIDQVPAGSILEILEDEAAGMLPELRAVSEDRASQPSAPGKWTVKQILGHVNDAERVFSYRLLRFSRNDQTELSSFEQDSYVANGGFENRSWASLVDEFEAVRRSSILLMKHLPHEAWSRTGIASGKSVSVRALAYIIAGHAIHHRALLHQAGVL